MSPQLRVLRAEREAREAAIQSIHGGTTADAIARVAHDEMFEFRRGVIRTPAMPDVVIFNNNPAHFRVAELAEVERLLAVGGYTVRSRGSYPPAGEKGAGYTVVLVVTRPDRVVSPDDLADLLTGALCNIGRSDPLFHEIRIED